MKSFIKIFFIVIATAGCSKEDPINNDMQSEPVSFEASEAVWGNTLKISSTGKSSGISPVITDMLVYGYHTASKRWNEVYDVLYPSFMDGIVVTYNGKGWFYEPTHYFFQGSNHSFFAVAPYILIANDARNSLSIPGNRGTPELEYYLPEEAVGHTDLLFGWATDITSAQGSIPVEIRFNHATTKITFSAGIAPDYMLPPFQSIRIKSIIFNDIYSYGKAKVENKKSGMPGISWYDQSQPKDISISIDDGALKDVVLTTTTTSISSTGRELYMIPQQLAGRDANEKPPVITFVFEIYNRITGSSQENIQSVDLALLNQSWKSGQAVNYQVLYNGAGKPISLILIDPGVDDPIELGPPLGE